MAQVYSWIRLMWMDGDALARVRRRIDVVAQAAGARVPPAALPSFHQLQGVA